MRTGNREVGRRAIRSGADHGLSSLTNLLVSAGVAHRFGAEGLGRFTLLFSIYVLLLGVHRQLVGELVLSAQDDERTLTERSSTTLTGIGAIAAGLTIAGFGVLLRDDLTLVAGIAIVPLLLFENARLVAYGRGDLRTPTIANGTWLLATAAVIVARPETVAIWYAGWSLGAAAGLLYLTVSAPTRLGGVGISARWWSSQREFVAGLAVAGIANTLGTQAAVWVIAAMAGQTALGFVKGAQMLLSPIPLLQTAVGNVLTPLLARREVSVSPGYLMSAGTVGALVWVAVLIGARTPIGQLVLGYDAAPPTSVLAWIALGTTLSATAWGNIVHLRARRRSKSIARAYVLANALGLIAVSVASPMGTTYAAATLSIGPAIVLLMLRRTLPAEGTRNHSL